MSVVSDLKSGASAAIEATPVGAASGLISGAISSIFGGIQARKQYKRQKKLMKLQHEYELENMAKQDEYQRALQEDSNLLTKSSLMKAGYSTADPNGTGVTPASVSGPSTSASGSASMANVHSDGNMLGANYSNLVNARNTESVTELNKIEARWREKKLESEYNDYQIRIQTMRESLPLTIENLKKDIDLKASEIHINEKQKEKIQEEISNLQAVTEGINIDNRYKDDLNKWTVDKIKNECRNLMYEGDIKQVEAELAKYGIIVGADWFTQLAALSVKGKSDEMLDLLTKFVADVCSKLPSVAGQLVNSTFDMIKEGVETGKKFIGDILK